jgi:pimeloyl-ACP methyl ester carboxylesterase
LLFASSVLAVLVLMMVCQAICVRVDARKFPAPGRLVKIPGGQIHVRESGRGEPAVVLEAGIAASSLNWSMLQPQLAASFATYSYDRTGFGWSVSEDASCSLAKLTDDLHAWLAALPVAAPYILVAHSFGAYIVTAYTQRFAGELAGIVLVDPLTPQEWITPTREQRWRLHRGVWFSRAGGVLAGLGVLRACLFLLQRGNREAPRGVLRLFGPQAFDTVERILRELAKLPPDVVRVIRARWSRPPFFWTMANYIRSVPECAAELDGCSIPPDVAVTVISGAHQPAERMQEHAAIAAHSLRGRHLVADESAHWVHLDQPELIVSAVRELAALGFQKQSLIRNAEG